MKWSDPTYPIHVTATGQEQIGTFTRTRWRNRHDPFPNVDPPATRYAVCEVDGAMMVVSVPQANLLLENNSKTIMHGYVDGINVSFGSGPHH